LLNSQLPPIFSDIKESLWKRTLQKHQIISDTLFYDNSNFATYIDALSPCVLPQRGKPKKGSPKQRLVIDIKATIY
jgi:hypothetical protein